MKKLNLFLSTILLMWMVGANAHGPVRQKLQESIKIDASVDVVWDKLQDFGTVTWLPMVESVEASGENEKGATRVLTLKDGGTISEKLKKHDEKKMSYSYKITDMSVVKTIHHSGVDEPVKVLPVTDYTATIMVKEDGKGAEVTWKAAYYRGYMNNNPPAELNEEAARDAIQTVFLAGLENLKSMAESNQPVESTSKSVEEPVKDDKAGTKTESKVVSDSNYPAANFEPEVIFIDEDSANKGSANESAASSAKGEKSVFDAKYPAANFEPKVIYP